MNPKRGTRSAALFGMAKEIIKYKSKNRTKAGYTREGMAQDEALREENRGQGGLTIDNVIMGGRKRGHGRGKASDAGPPRKKKAI
jgi:hypothetical protein